MEFDNINFEKAGKEALSELYKLTENDEKTRKIIGKLLMYIHFQTIMTQRMIMSFAQSLSNHLEKGHTDAIKRKDIFDFLFEIEKQIEQEKKT